MRNKGLTRVTAVALLLTFLAACSGKSHDAASTTSVPPPTPTTAATVQATPPTTAPNPDVIPPVITVAYVNAVFAVLNHINGDAVRALVAANQVTSTVRLYLRAVYNDPLYAEEVKIAQQSIDGSLSNVRQPPGDRTTRTNKLIAATKSCVFIETSTDLSRVLVHPTAEAASEYYTLTAKQPRVDPQHLNPTPWAISFNATYVVPTTIPNQCPAA